MNVPLQGPVFLLGAGFNADARRQLQCAPYDRSSPLPDDDYPLVNQLAEICFGLPEPPTDRSIEDLFLRAEQEQDLRPIEMLVDHLAMADMNVACQLALLDHRDSYSRFFSSS